MLRPRRSRPASAAGPGYSGRYGWISGQVTMPMKEKEVAQLPGLRQWVLFRSNSLADAESGRGALTRRELEQSLPVGREAYRQGRLAPEVVGRLFSGEAESVELLRVVLRPAVYMALLEHGQGRRALFPERKSTRLNSSHVRIS